VVRTEDNLAVFDLPLVDQWDDIKVCGTDQVMEGQNVNVSRIQGTTKGAIPNTYPTHAESPQEQLSGGASNAARRGAPSVFYRRLV